MQYTNTDTGFNGKQHGNIRDMETMITSNTCVVMNNTVYHLLWLMALLLYLPNDLVFSARY